MKSSSHRTLSQYLIANYMQECPGLCRKAFSIGCIQPDKNPTTYLKGSLRWQWLRGHNWDNAKAYIRRSGNYLQDCKKLNILEFYRLGKLIHYIADAFTYSHNKQYPHDLSAHRIYEKNLNIQFESYLLSMKEDLEIICDTVMSVSEFISKNHRRYIQLEPCPENDVIYCVRMCSQVLQLLLQGKYLAHT